MQSVTTDPIRALGLKKFYTANNCFALRGLNFGVEKNQIFALLGPNGSGKSTTINILTAQLPGSEGKVYLQ